MNVKLRTGGHLQGRISRRRAIVRCADLGPGLEIHGRADQSAGETPCQQQEAEKADQADAAISRAASRNGSRRT